MRVSFTSALADPQPPRSLIALVVAGSPGAAVLMMVGLLSAALGHRFGAYLLLGAICTQFASHLAIGILWYREVMRRPWPNVEALGDDEW